MTSKDKYQKKWIQALIYLVLLSFVWTLNSCENETKQPESTEISISGTTFDHEGNLTFYNGDSAIIEIEIEIAETEGAINQGLMHRKSMKFDRGMLFIFDDYEPRSFWMENTIIPLDIIYVNDTKEIVSIKEHTTPYSRASVTSDNKPAKYVIEVNAGFTGSRGIKEGGKIEFSRL